MQLGTDEILGAADRATSAMLLPWLCRAVAAKTQGGDLGATATYLGASERIAARIKAATEATSLAGVPELRGDAVLRFLDGAKSRSIFAALVAGGTVESVSMNERIVAFAGEFGYTERGEAVAVPLTTMDLEGFRVERRSAGCIVAMTNEAWRRVGPGGQSFVTRTLQAGVGKVLDQKLFALLTTSATSDLSFGATPDAIQTGLADLLAIVRTEAGARPYFAVSPALWNRLTLMDNAALNPTNGFIGDVPAVPTDGLSGERIAMLDGLGIAADIDAIRVVNSGHASIEFRDDPTSDATTHVSLFQTNTTAVRLTLDYGATLLRDTAIAFATIVPAGA